MQRKVKTLKYKAADNTSHLRAFLDTNFLKNSEFYECLLLSLQEVVEKRDTVDIICTYMLNICMLYSLRVFFLD